MTRNIAQDSQPLYGRFWEQLKQFPRSLHRGSDRPPAHSGGAAAFLISGGIGSVAMMVAHHIVDPYPEWTKAMLKFGSWMPGAASTDPMWGNIGSYAGKETVMLLGWLISLAILYPLLKNKDVKPRTLLFWLLSLYTIATAMSWHPFFPYLPLQ